MKKKRAPARKKKRAIARKKSPEKRPDEKPKPGQLVVPSHGGGLIRHGATPGSNSGGSGRPPGAVRRMLSDFAYEKLPAMLEVWGTLTHEQQQEFMERIVLKYGVGTTTEITADDVRDRLARTIQTIRDVLPAETAEHVLNRLQPIWG